MPPVRSILIAGAAVLALAIGLAALAPTASAQGATTATTTLRPGLNLAGWTEAEADAAALFEAIPNLDMAYAYDAGAQRFRWAARDGSGDLATLTPGMGLWLALGGTERFTWTRPMLPPGGIGLIPLREGWNFVAWAGRDGTAPGEAFRGLDDVLTEAWGWNARAQRREHYAPGARARGNALYTLYNGSAYWLRVSGAKHWWQFPPRAEFVGEFTSDKQAELRALIDSVVSFFIERTGIAVPGLTFQFGSGRASVGSYGDELIYLQEPFTAGAHEHTHAVQEYLATIEENGRSGHVEVRYRDNQIHPAWLREGVANYWSHRYHDETSEQTYDGRIRADIRAVRRVPTRLRDIERDMKIGGDAPANYSLGTLAINWLIDRVGESSIMDFYRERPSHPDWRAAFRAVFGMSVDDFYDAFEAYRMETAPLFAAHLRGTVTDINGDPMSGMLVGAFRHPGPDGKEQFTERTDLEGAFSFHPEPYIYRMHVHSDQVDECTVFSSIANEPTDAIFNIPRDATVTMRLVVRRAILPKARWFPCGWGGVDTTLARGAQ